MTNVYRSKEFDNAAKSRSWLNLLAKKAVEDKNFHVVLTLTQSVGFIKQKPKELPKVKHGADLIFPRKFLRPDKQYLAIKKAKSERKSLDERIKDMKAYAKKSRESAKQRIKEGHGPTVCHYEYDLDKFIDKTKAYLEAFAKAPLAPVHSYVQNKVIAMTRSDAWKRKYEQKLIAKAFKPFTQAELRKIRNYKIWRANEAVRLEKRAEFFNRQVDFWKKKLEEEKPNFSCKHRIKVRKYTGYYGEPYFYNRRDVYIPKYAFCDTFPEPLR